MNGMPSKVASVGGWRWWAGSSRLYWTHVASRSIYSSPHTTELVGRRHDIPVHVRNNEVDMAIRPSLSISMRSTTSCQSHAVSEVCLPRDLETLRGCGLASMSTSDPDLDPLLSLCPVRTVLSTILLLGKGVVAPQLTTWRPDSQISTSPVVELVC